MRQAARAGPPFATDDPEPADYQSVEIYIAPQYAHAGASVGGTSPNLDVNYGILHNVHVTFAFPLAFARTSPGTAHMGVGDVQAGLYPALSIPTGDSVDELGAGSLQTFLPLWAQKNFGRSSVYGGGGVHFNPGPGNRTWWYTGAVFNRALTPELSVGVEGYHSSPATWAAADSTGFNVGGSRAFGSRHSLLLSFGRTVGATNVFSGFAAYEIRILHAVAAHQ